MVALPLGIVVAPAALLRCSCGALAIGNLRAGDADGLNAHRLALEERVVAPGRSAILSQHSTRKDTTRDILYDENNTRNNTKILVEHKIEQACRAQETAWRVKAAYVSDIPSTLVMRLRKTSSRHFRKSSRLLLRKKCDPALPPELPTAGGARDIHAVVASPVSCVCRRRSSASSRRRAPALVTSLVTSEVRSDDVVLNRSVSCR